MSRSKKKTSKLGLNNSPSEKKDKQAANRVFRRNSKQQINSGKEPITDINEVITTWDMAKDGKRYVKKPNAKQMRK